MTQVYKIQLSMNQRHLVDSGLTFKQGDFGFQIEIEVLDFNVTGVTPQIVFRKPNGAVESTSVTASGNKFTYTMAGTELDTPGPAICDLKLKNSTTQRISTASFRYFVEADTMDGLNQQAGSYSDTVKQLVDELSSEFIYIDDAEYVKNGYLKADNTIQSISGYNSVVTKKLPCSEGDIFIYTGYGYNLAVSAIYFNGSSIVRTFTGDYQNRLFVIPSGVTHARFASFLVDDTKDFGVQRVVRYRPTAYNTKLNYEPYGYYKYDDTIVNDNSINSVYTDKISCSEGEIFRYTGFASGSSPVCIFYNDNTIVSYISGNGTYSQDRAVLVPSGCNYVRFCSLQVTSTGDAMLEIYKDTNVLNYRFELILNKEDSGFYSVNDAIQYSSSVNGLYTNKILCAEGDVFYYTGTSSAPSSSGTAPAYLLYNDNTLIQAVKIGGPVKNYGVVIPSGVNYIRFCSIAASPEKATIFVEKNVPLSSSAQIVNSPLYQKKINVLGDSYVANHHDPVSYTWHYKLAQKYLMTYRNYGINGNGIVSGSNPMSTRYVDMDDDADYVLVIGGTNDFNAQTSITNFKTLLDTFIENLVAKYPTKIIAFLTIFNSLTQANPASGITKTIELEEYNNAIIDECKKYGIPVFDSWHCSDILAWNSSFRSAFFQSGDDIAHLNNDGHNKFLPVAEAFMKTIG